MDGTHQYGPHSNGGGNPKPAPPDTERSTGILKLLAVCIKAGTISGVHQSNARLRPHQPGQRPTRRIASLITVAHAGSGRVKLQADVLAALDTQRRIAGAL